MHQRHRMCNIFYLKVFYEWMNCYRYVSWMSSDPFIMINVTYVELLHSPL